MTKSIEIDINGSPYLAEALSKLASSILNQPKPKTQDKSA
jgi:hypothetical protein